MKTWCQQDGASSHYALPVPEKNVYLKSRIRFEIPTETPEMLHNVQKEWRCSFNYCQEAGAWQLEHLFIK